MRLIDKLKRACKIAKENWLEEQCQEIEYLEKHLIRQMHEKIRRVTKRRQTTQTTGIMDKHDIASIARPRLSAPPG